MTGDRYWVTQSGFPDEIGGWRIHLIDPKSPATLMCRRQIDDWPGWSVDGSIVRENCAGCIREWRRRMRLGLWPRDHAPIAARKRFAGHGPARKFGRKP
jgi:hypothetical protein